VNIEKTNNSYIKKAKQIAQEIGILNPEDITVVKIEEKEDKNKKILELIQGKWDNDAPWFVVDETGRVFVLSSIESIFELLIL